MYVVTSDADDDRGRRDAARAHEQLVDTGRDRRVQPEFDSFVWNLAYIDRAPVSRAAIKDQSARILEPDDGGVLVALRVVPVSGRVGWSIQLSACQGKHAVLAVADALDDGQVGAVGRSLAV